MNRPAWPLALCLVLVLSLLLPLPLQAQESETPEAKKAVKEKAREERIQEYLQKKEERRLRREGEEMRKLEEAEAKQTAAAMAGSVAVTEPLAVSAEPTGKKPKKERAPKQQRKAKQAPERSSQLPRRMARMHDNIRNSEFGQDPTVGKYMDLIGSGNASAQQVAAFGNFLGQAGRLDSALAYYDLALSMDGRDTTIWLNAGTLQRQAGNLNQAAGAYAEALGLDPNHAYAHYNLGAVLDQMGEYDSAVEEYKIALTLDPTLGDPAINPQAANNEKLMTVRLLLYKEQAGNLGLPLVTVPKGEVDGGN